MYSPLVVTVLFPHFDHAAIEERFASWQARTRFRDGGAGIVPYSPDDRACDVAGEVESTHVLVVTDPLLLPSKNLSRRLIAALQGSVEAAVPVMNLPANPAQQTNVDTYATLRELEVITTKLEAREADVLRMTWDASDPFVFACRADMLDAMEVPLRQALTGKTVAVSRNDYVHRWASMRGQARQDLLDRIATDAKSILEFGCGEAPLGAALKQRQKCRVVGIEIDRHAAAIAKKRIDDVYCGDAREIIALVHEEFDWIIGGDIIEHLDDPWTFLSDLRRITKPGGRLLLSIPNLSHAALVADLLAGRFDYVYMGMACVGHLRFFTRHSIAEMLSIAGWSVERIEPQAEVPSIGAESLLRALEESRLPFSRDDLLAPGYYVTARKI
jgi:2-polyprenyl-3-methyl-5-hydroxy-6-metoxy-1,4-benzoquinol methylase